MIKRPPTASKTSRALPTPLKKLEMKSEKSIKNMEILRGR
jgi:hypothetical protein